MAKVTSMAATAAAAAAAAPISSVDKPKNTKWNNEAHQALVGTLLDTMDLADTKWRANLDFMLRPFLFSVSIKQQQQAPSIKQPPTAKVTTTTFAQLTMPSVWDETRQRDLLEEIYFVLSSRQSLTQEDKDAVVAGMQSRGYATLNWNAIR
ncbi:hypothetical protein Daus18300_011301 [Diaporthe australafricana]|uniref:Uncharacterized protein n=1 Tax=Diaporthe australafricana TaxID=127596 RepID=A0ABR3W719_9PEZI